MKKCNCLRCTHTWVPRKLEEPNLCPKCKSVYWNAAKIKKPSQNLVKNLFDYHEEGFLTWKISTNNRIKIGDMAGNTLGKCGYMVISIFGKYYRTHRIIFLWHHGYLPEGIVDHRDRIKIHNWIDNLRDTSHSCNSRNCNVGKRNTSGIIGVTFLKKEKKWRAYILKDKRTMNLGHFIHLDDAVLARWNKEIELNWNGCNSTSSAYLYLKEKGLLPKKRISRIIKYIKNS
jgi:hypothetical protein